MSNLEEPTYLQTAHVMDSVSLAREDSVCALLTDTAMASGWVAGREWCGWESRSRIDVFATKAPMNMVIMEAKKGYSKANFPYHVAQAAGYGTMFTESYIGEMCHVMQTEPMSARGRSRFLGEVIGRVAATDVMLVCPGFNEAQLPDPAFQAAEEGVLAMSVSDAVRYLAGNELGHVSAKRHSLYQRAKQRLAAPAIARLLSSE